MSIKCSSHYPLINNFLYKHEKGKILSQANREADGYSYLGLKGEQCEQPRILCEKKFEKKHNYEGKGKSVVVFNSSFG